MAMYPVLLKVGPLTIYSYGTMMAIAFLSAMYLTGRELRRKDLPEVAASSMVLWAAGGGLVGARLLTIAEDFSAFVEHPLQFIITGAGFVWYGGLAGGFLAVAWSIRRLKLPFLRTIDCTAPGLALGHGIGRIGCQLAGDGDWGKVSTLPWAMAYPNAIVGWNYPLGVRVHPTPIYELIAYTAVFLVLWFRRTHQHADGNLFWWYLILAPGARFLIEFVRINNPVVLGLTQAQLTSLLLIAVGTCALLSRHASRVGERPAVRSSR